MVAHLSVMGQQTVFMNVRELAMSSTPVKGKKQKVSDELKVFFIMEEIHAMNMKEKLLIESLTRRNPFLELWL